MRMRMLNETLWASYPRSREWIVSAYLRLNQKDNQIIATSLKSEPPDCRVCSLMVTIQNSPSPQVFTPALFIDISGKISTTTLKYSARDFRRPLTILALHIIIAPSATNSVPTRLIERGNWNYFGTNRNTALVFKHRRIQLIISVRKFTVEWLWKQARLGSHSSIHSITT